MPTFSEAWAALEQERQGLTAYVLGLDLAKQSVPSVPKAFSPAETLEHMAIVESVYFPLIQKYDFPGVTGKPNFLYGIVMRQMAKKKAIPAPPMFVPKESKVDAVVAGNHWDTVRRELGEALKILPFDKVCLKHPIFGKMCPEHIVAICTEHTRYHRARV